MRASRLTAFLCSTTACLALAGCAVVPQPLSLKEVLATNTVNAQRVTQLQEPIYGPITLYEAMARAIKYNLDYRLEMRKQSLRDAEVQQARAEMLPKLAANAGYTARNNDLITSTLDIPTGTEVSPNTISQERAYNSGDVTFSWDVLDFALSYERAKQASDSYLIEQEARRKVIQQIIEDTRTAYWRAVSADRMSRKLAHLNGRVAVAISGWRTLQQDGADSPMTALTSERELVQIRRTAEDLQHELNLAKSQLASLMNVAPGTKFLLAAQAPAEAPDIIDMSAKDMVAEAVFNRPEIREVAYQGRITEHEATAALLELLPNIKDYGMDAFNDNRFLLNNNWLGWGASVGGNLVKLVQLPERQEAIESSAATIDKRALATTMVVMTQVFVSRTRYRHFTDELETSTQYVETQNGLVDNLRAEANAGAIGTQTLIREEMNLLVAEVERDVAVANLENAAANMMVSMGLDVQPKDVDFKLGVRELTGALKARSADRVALSDRGKYLMELEKARLDAIRKKEEEERRRIEDTRRIAAEAQRVKDEEIARVKHEIQLARDEAARAKLEQARIAKQEAWKARQEVLAAASEARRIKADAQRAHTEEVRQHLAEVALAQKEAHLAVLEAKHTVKAETVRLRAEAKAAREDAKRMRKDALQTRKGDKSAPADAHWEWPWEDSEWVWPWQDNPSAKPQSRRRKP